MKRVISTLLVASLMTSALFAKGPGPKRGDFQKMKKAKIAKLEAKREIIQKRLSCIKGAKASSEIKMCEKKYPLAKRGKKMDKMKKKMMKKKLKKKNMNKKTLQKKMRKQNNR